MKVTTQFDPIVPILQVAVFCATLWCLWEFWIDEIQHPMRYLVNISAVEFAYTLVAPTFQNTGILVMIAAPLYWLSGFALYLVIGMLFTMLVEYIDSFIDSALKQLRT